MFKVKEAEDEAESPDSLFGRQLPDLLGSFLNLRAVFLAGKLGEDLSTILEVLSRVNDLNGLELVVKDNSAWTNELTSIFRRGFRRVSRLRLVVDWIEITPQPDTVPLQSGGCIPVRNLLLAWYGNSQSPRFAQELFSTFDLNTVRSVALTPASYCYSINQLLLCPNLLRLEISCLQSAVSPTFSSVLDFLPRFPSLHQLKIFFVHKGGPQQVQSPVSLSAVLASFPPSLERFEAQQFIFPDFETLPLRPMKTLEEYGPVTLDALYPLNAEQTETKKLVVWGKEEKEGGRIRWYRDADSEDEKQRSCRHDFQPLAFS
jgi:hypothetical protein